MIRKLQPEDLRIIADIGNRAWQSIYQNYKENIYGPELFEAKMPGSDTVKGEQIIGQCQEHPDWVFICEENNKIVGFVTFRLNHLTKIGEICNNAVDPECGLKGIGQQMYQAVLAHFVEQGMQYAEVTTGLDAGHARARRAYERAGFDIHAENITYFKKLSDE
jgi:ribosomal protein S18 acetylase RimI-like enzyme